jgi:GT2 family glycosyltransferase
MEIYVIDNDSSDGSPQAVKENYPDINLLQNEKNIGFAKANNIGINQSQGKYVCFINSDVKVLNGCLESMVEFMDEHESVGMVGPRILNPDMTLQYSCRMFPTLWNNFCAAVGLTRAFPRIRFFNDDQMRFFKHDKVIRTQVLSGCFQMVRRMAIKDVGNLDERFFIYSEDVDWCKRFWKRGWEVVFFPQAQAIHYGGGSSANAPVIFSGEKDKSMLQYWRKHHKNASYYILIGILSLGHLIRITGASILYLIRPSNRSRMTYILAKHLECLKLLINSGI